MPERNFDSVRTDLDAHGHVMSLRIAQVVEELVELLGASTVAVIGGVNETRAVQQWIATSGNPERARAWFAGSNPHLDDKCPP